MATTELPQTDAQTAEVLTLAEVAAYLRVSEDAILNVIQAGTLPAQRIGGEWRFLKQAVVEWLGAGESHEQTGKKTGPRRGSKEAVMRHVGVFKDDGDLDQQLAALRAQRKATDQ